jgi:predicted NBD/HSP70 family sugar kinase
MTSALVGVDVGGTTIEAIVVNGNGLAGQSQCLTSHAGFDRVVADIARLVETTLSDAGRSLDDMTAVGIGLPGQVDPETGWVHHAVNLGVGANGYPFAAALGEILGDPPLAVENDVRAATLGAFEHFADKRPGLRSLAYLSIGTGISAGLVVDGRLHRGAEGMAGEIGHVEVEPDGPECRCGLRGCLEAVAAGPAIARLWPGKNPATSLYRAAADGDQAAKAIVAQISRILANTVQWLVMASGVEVVVLGGGVASVGDPFLASIREHLAERAARSELAALVLPPDKVVLLPSGHPVGAMGAVELVRRTAAGVGGTTVSQTRGGP